jgi:hypothetical protein
MVDSRCYRNSRRTEYNKDLKSAFSLDSHHVSAYLGISRNDETTLTPRRAGSQLTSRMEPEGNHSDAKSWS